MADPGDPSGFAYLFQGQEWDEEVGLYNFKARFYDPVTRRFLAPDPVCEFASPYVFAGNNPLTVMDPEGESSLWAQVGVGVALVALTAAGLALGAASGGTSVAAAASAGSAVASAEAAGAAGAVSAQAGVAAVSAQGAAQVAAGATASAATAGAGATTASTLATKVVGSVLTSMGTSGLTYLYEAGGDFTTKGLMEAVGIGAAAGVAGGFVSAAGGAVTLGVGQTTATRIGAKALVGGVSSMVSSEVTTYLTNAMEGEPWYKGMAESSLTGFATGLATGAASGAWAEKANLAKAAGVSDQTYAKVETMLEKAKASATTSNAYGIYGTAAFFLTSGYFMVGAATNWGDG